MSFYFSLQCIYVIYDRKEEQEENQTAVIDALKAYDKNIHSFKAAKYIGNSANSSTSSMNDESGISSDESQRTTQGSETTDAVAEHSPVCSQLSTSTLRSDSATVSDVSIIHHFLYSCQILLHILFFSFWQRISILLCRIIASRCFDAIVYRWEFPSAPFRPLSPPFCPPYK